MTDSVQPSPGPLPQRITFSATPEVEAGVYANFVGVWHQPDCFVLDFSVFVRPPQLAEDDDGNRFVDGQARMVSRVRIPPQQVFEIMKALEQHLSAWERESGQRPPDVS